MSNLRECECDHRIMTMPDVRKASKVVVREANYPIRIVLREKGPNGEGKMEYAVSKELLELDRDPERNHLTIPLKHVDFIEGSYTTDYNRAIILYEDRVRAL